MTSKLLIMLILISGIKLNAAMIYQDPKKEAKYVNIHTTIVIGFDEKIKNPELNAIISATGSKSGVHQGDVVLIDNGRKLIFKPHRAFSFDETVQVNLKNIRTGNRSNFNQTYYFYTQKEKPFEDNRLPFYYEDETHTEENYIYSLNPVVLPVLTVNASNNPTPGRIFLVNFRTFFAPYYPPHLIISNNDGSNIYFREEVDVVCDYKKVKDGRMVYYKQEGGKYYAEDLNFNLVDSFYCGNGYSTDLHDLQVLDNGHALVMSYDRQPVDMSLIVPGGDPEAIVVGLIVQEIDEDKNVVFQWRSWDHYDILDATHVNLTASVVDYVHGNAIEQDDDGNILISARHLSEITKISRTTGDIIWRLGGENNQFTFPNDSIEISYQHDIRRIANGNITFFDNGNFRPVRFSRAVEYQLDETNMTATLVWQYRATPDRYGATRGSVQRLSNGNTFICWGSINPGFTEVTPSGSVALEMTFPSGVYSYRGYKEELDLSLDVKLIPEGLYNSTTGMLNLSDTIDAYLRSSSSPYGIIDSSRSVIDSVSMTGSFKFYNSYSGNYYLAIKHRNSLETWSKEDGITLVNGTAQSYDMTGSSLQAYGNNLVQVDSIPLLYALYSGDINRDAIIELSDVLSIYNDAAGFITGYNASDLTGNLVSDLNDVLIAYNNSERFVGIQIP